MKTREFVRKHLEPAGGVLDRKSGDHHIYRLPNGHSFAVPMGGKQSEAANWLLPKLRRLLRVAPAAAVLLLVAACGGNYFTSAPASVVDPSAGDSGEDAALDQDAGQPTGDGPVAVDHDAGPWLEEAGTNNSDAVTREAGSPDAQPDVMADDAAVSIPDAQSDVVDAQVACVDDLSDIGASDFHVAFDLLATSTETDGPLVEQRATCGQYDAHWLVAEAAGHLVAQTYDGSAGATIQSVATVDDGVLHRVVVARVSGALSISIDGAIDTSEPNAVFAPGSLPAMQVGRSACAPQFSGQVSSVCVERR
jgi:hypothetical protein